MNQSFHTVVFVCEQNIYRSIAAEAVFKYLCAATQLPLRITSAGIHAGDGAPPHDHLVQVADQRGYDMGGLRSRRLTEDDLRAGTLLVASDRHVATVVQSLLARMTGAASTQGAPPRVELLSQFAQTFAAEFKDNQDLVAGESPREARALLDRVEDACLGLLNAMKPE